MAKYLKYSFAMAIYSDDDNAITKTEVGIERTKVNASTIISVKLNASGGETLFFTN